MKKDQQEQINLDDVIMAYMAASVDAGEDQLAEWIARYPEYESELREFASYWKLTERMPAMEYTDEEEQRLAARASSVIQNILYGQRRNSPECQAETFSGIIDEAERQHMSLDELAERTDLSPAIITMMDDRRVRFSSIPRKAVESIAGVLRKLIATVESYLQEEMRPAPAHYRADGPPKAIGSYDFAYLVDIDPDLSPQQKQEWLALTKTASAAEPDAGERRA